MRSRVPYATRDHVKNYFSLPNNQRKLAFLWIFPTRCGMVLCLRKGGVSP